MGGGGQLLTLLKHSNLYLSLASIVSLKFFEMLFPCVALLFSCVSTIINHRIFFSRILNFIDIEGSGLLELHAMSFSIYLP